MTDGANSEIFCPDQFPLEQQKRFIISAVLFWKEIIAENMDWIQDELSFLFHMIMTMLKF